MSLTVSLNFAWGAIAFAAVLWLALLEHKRSCNQGHKGCWKRIASVVLAICFLFPCVSASDDILGLSTLRHGHGGDSTPSKQVIHLDRVLQELENLQISASFVLVLTLFCIGLVATASCQGFTPSLRCLTGRGPPLAV